MNELPPDFLLALWSNGFSMLKSFTSFEGALDRFGMKTLDSG